jgi:hypothetical protein
MLIYIFPSTCGGYVNISPGPVTWNVHTGRLFYAASLQVVWNESHSTYYFSELQTYFDVFM